MNTPQYIPSFYFYKFAQEISEPFTSLQAYQAGAIDEHGNILKAESSIDPLEYLVIKLKKIFAELPSGMTKAKLNNYLSTLQLFGEEVQQIGITEGEYMGLVEGHIALYVNQNLSYIELCEDMSGGGMASAGTSPGYNTGSVSGFDPQLVSGIQRRKPLLKGLDNCEMYDVCPEEMGHFKAAKAWKHVPNSETKTYLQRAQSRNAKKIAVRSVNPDTGEQDVHWINYPTKSFAEEYHLGFLDILNEKNDEVTPDKNLDGKTSVEEVMTYFKDKDLNGSPDGEHHAKISRIITNLFNNGADPTEQKLGILQNPNAPTGHHAELHARLLSLGRGLDELHKIEDHDKKHESISTFVTSHLKGSRKSPSASDRPSGKLSKDMIPDTFIYDPTTQTTVHGEVKTSKASGTFPTEWPSIGKKLIKADWAKQGVDLADLEKTTRGRYRIKLPPETAQELSSEAGTQLVRYGKKSGPLTIIKAETGKFYEIDTPDVIEHWAKGLDYPSIKRKTRGKGKAQGKSETAGHSVELTPLTGFMSAAIKQKSARRVTMSKKAYTTIKAATDPSLHEHLDKLLLPHTTD
tara:strand:- start:356 stop:2080 length:1725 start_codon:yes stop_codon:yes gene_type:complete